MKKMSPPLKWGRRLELEKLNSNDNEIHLNSSGAISLRLLLHVRNS